MPRLVWRRIPPWVIIPVALIALPFIVLWQFVQHPRQTWRHWQASRRIY